MPTRTWDKHYSAYPSAAAKTGLTVEIDTGEGGIPSDAVINKVSFTVEMSAEIANSNYRWCMDWFAVGSKSGSPYFAISNPPYKVVMSSDDYVFYGNLKFSQSDVSKFSSGIIKVSFRAYSNQPDTEKTYVKSVSVTVVYNEESSSAGTGGGTTPGDSVVSGVFKAPGTPSLSPSSALMNDPVTISWSAGKYTDTDGEVMDVDYEIYYKLSTEDDDEYMLLGSGDSSCKDTIYAPDTPG